MTIFVFTALLGAAFFHASWNALVKNSADKIKSMLVLTLVHGILGIFVAFFVEFPKLEVWPWLITSAIFHVIYQGCLALAYNSGDLSRVYPIARGTAPILVLLIFYFVIETSMTRTEILGVLLLGFGVIGMAQGAFSNRENLILLPYTLGAAIGTAGYTIFDGIGSRISTDPSSYIAWLFIITVPIFFLSNLNFPRLENLQNRTNYLENRFSRRNIFIRFILGRYLGNDASANTFGSGTQRNVDLICSFDWYYYL